MTIEEALNVLDRILQESLNDTQESVFRQAWAGQSYPEIAQDLNYTTEHIRAVGAQLWRSLTIKLGERVTMQNFRTVIRRWAEQNSAIQLSAVSQKRQDWGEAADVSTFFGRTAELAALERWVVHDRCRLVALLGMGGMGKTSLSIRLAQQVQNDFDCLIWRSLRNAPPLPELLTSLLQFLLGEEDGEPPKDVNDQLSRLIQYLRDRRCLIILDNLEAILHSGNSSNSIANHYAGQYRESYEDYGELLKRLGEISHQSCLLITSREEPKEVDIQTGETEPVRSFQLPGLTKNAGQKLFEVRGNFSAAETDWEQLIHHYAGNPLALKMVASVIQDLFDSNVAKFLGLLRHGTPVFDDIRDLLQRQFDRLSDDEKEIMYWLAIDRELVPLPILQHDITSPISQRHLPEALRSLGRRFLIEKSPQGFTQQPIVMEYVLEQFIEQVCQEISTEDIHLLMSHAFIKAQAKSYVREGQIRLVLGPIGDRLCALLNSKQAVETKLKQIILKLKAKFPQSPGYAAGNVLNLLHQLKIDLTNYDFSNLTVWQAYLQGVRLHQVNFANCNLSRSVFTETLGNIWAVAFSPNTKLLAASDTVSEIHIWRVQDGKKLLTCSGHTNWTACIAFSPDSSILASGSADSTIKLWDANTGQCLRTLQGHADWLLSVAFSPDGKLLASSSADHTVKIWHISTGECLHTLTDHTNWVRSVAFAPLPRSSNAQNESSSALTDNLLLASGSADDTIKFWDVTLGRCLRTIHADSSGIWSIAFSRDGQMLATGGADATVKLWQPASGQCLKILKGHQSHVRSVAFSEDGSRVVSGSEDQTIRLWNVLPVDRLHESSRDCFKVLQGHTSAVWSVACSNTYLFASGSLDQRVKLWDIRTGQCLTTLQGYTDFVWSICFPEGILTPSSLLASGSADHSVKLWDAQSGQCLMTLQGHSNWVLSVAFSPDHDTLASGSFDQTIRLWDSRSGDCLKVLRGHTNWVLSVKFSPVQINLPSGIGHLLGSGSFDGTVKLWDVNTGECLKTLSGHEGRVWSIAFSPDGQIVASASEDQTVRLWHAITGECLQVLEGHLGRVWCVAFHPNGDRIATGGKDQTIRIWDRETGECLQALKGHSSRVQSIAFSPDGNLLASGSEDKTVKLWNFHTGECVKTLAGHTSCVWSVAFGQIAVANPNHNQPATSEPQQILASGGEDETIRLWNIATGSCFRTLKGPCPYQNMNIAGVTGLTDAQKSTLKALGAIDLNLTTTPTLAHES